MNSLSGFFWGHHIWKTSPYFCYCQVYGYRIILFLFIFLFWGRVLGFEPRAMHKLCHWVTFPDLCPIKSTIFVSHGNKSLRKTWDWRQWMILQCGLQKRTVGSLEQPCKMSWIWWKMSYVASCRTAPAEIDRVGKVKWWFRCSKQCEWRSGADTRGFITRN